MSKHVISSTKITKSYQMSNSAKGYNGNQNNKIKQPISQTLIRKEIQKTFTGQAPSNMASYQANLIQNNIANNLDSSVGSSQRRGSYNQNLGAYGSKWRTSTNSTYNKTINTNLTGEDYCTCDDAREGFNCCTCYKRNTSNTLNKTFSSNDQNIYIQEGNNSTDYCNCDEKEKKIFSNQNSEYEKNQNILTEEELNMNNYCTCGQDQRSTFETSGKLTNKLQYSTNIMTSSPLQTTDNEERESNGITDVKKVVKTQVNVEIIRKQIREQVRQELEEEREQNEEQITWNGENYIQVIERLQYLSAQAPALRVQFLNDMMINRTIDKEPINVLIPIPDNYIQKQAQLEVLSEPQEEKEEKDLNLDLCPENVDLLNISHAYSIPVPSFNNLEIENEEMQIVGVPKESEKEPFVIENNTWDIKPSQRTWSGLMRPVRVNKLEIEVSTKTDWNSLLEKELADRLIVIAPKKEKKIKTKPKVVKVEEPEEELEEEAEIEEEPEPEEEIEEEVVEVEDEFAKEEREKRKAEREKRKKEKELKARKKDPKRFRKNKFTITYTQRLKRFKTIDIGDNEIITLKAEKRILEPAPDRPEKVIKQSPSTTLCLGGRGFNPDKHKWAPVPFNAQSMTIYKSKEKGPLETISTDKMLMPASRKKLQDWNTVNDLSTQSTINILTKEKKLIEQKTKTITVRGVAANKNDWNDKLRRQKGFKFGFIPSKKWNLKINKEIDLFYEQESDDVIINDDYNNVKGPEMRPVTATIIKVKEEEETSSVSSYDVFQNVIVKRTNYEYGLGGLGGNGSFFKKQGGFGGYGAYQIGLGSGGFGLLRDRKDLDFGINGIGGSKRSLEFGMTGIGSSNLLRDKRNMEFEFGGLTSKGKKNIDLGYEFSFRNGAGGSSLLRSRDGYDIGLGISGGKVGKSGYKYEYEFSGPSNNKSSISQTKIITGKSTGGIFNGNNNVMNAGNSFNKTDMNKNITGETFKFTNSSFADQGRQNLFKLRVSSNSENEQKNKYDKTVKSLANQTLNLIGNVNMTTSPNTMNAAMNNINVNSITSNSNNSATNMNAIRGMNAMSGMNIDAESGMNAASSMNAGSGMNAEGIMRIMSEGRMNASSGMRVGSNMNPISRMNAEKNARNMNFGMKMKDTRNVIIGDKKMKKIEFIREDPEETNFLKI